MKIDSQARSWRDHREESALLGPLLPSHGESFASSTVSDAGRDWGQEEKGTTEDEMAGWHHRLDGREFQ